MSEFSESLHLRSGAAEDAVALLRGAGVRGVVCSGVGPFIAFVCSTEGDALARVIAHNEGLLIHYAYAEDHGCDVHVIQGGERVAKLKTYFEVPGGDHFDAGAFVSLGLLTVAQAAKLKRWVSVAHDYTQRSRWPEHVVAETLGLAHYRWLSYHYAALSIDEGGLNPTWIVVEDAQR